MPGVARIGDVWAGICCCHSDPTCVGMVGTIISCSGNSSANSRGLARLLDITIGACGHTGIIVTCSPNVSGDNRGVARLGDSVAGCNIGTIVTSSSNVNAN